MAVPFVRLMKAQFEIFIQTFHSDQSMQYFSAASRDDLDFSLSFLCIALSFLRMKTTTANNAIRLLDWTRLRTELLWAYEGSPLSPHFDRSEVDTVMCWLLLEGSVTAKSPTCGKIQACAGQWLFVARDKSSHDFSEDARIISLRLVIHWPSGQPLYAHDHWLCFGATEFPQLEKLAMRLIKQAERIVDKSNEPEHNRTRLNALDCDFADYLELENATNRWVNAYDRAMQKMGHERLNMQATDVRVSQCLKIIEQLPMDRQFEEAQVAKSLGLSVSQLNRIFVQAMKCTPRNYAQNMRLDDAINLLTTTQMPLKELAFTLGFKQPSHFASWFKKMTDQYPKAYRQQLEKHPWHHQMIQTLKSR
jgi:AraC-like DNA-binding protein